MERIAECHCGALKVIATGEPERVYLCHCQACRRRTGTAFHSGASYRKDQVRLEGERKIYERGADSGNRIRFYFCPNCGSNLYWEGDRNPAVCGVCGRRVRCGRLPAAERSIWEESMHPWLGLPAGTLHYPQGRAPGM